MQLVWFTGLNTHDDYHTHRICPSHHVFTHTHTHTHTCILYEWHTNLSYMISHTDTVSALISPIINTHTHTRTHALMLSVGGRERERRVYKLEETKSKLIILPFLHAFSCPLSPSCVLYILIVDAAHTHTHTHVQYIID